MHCIVRLRKSSNDICFLRTDMIESVKIKDKNNVQITDRKG